jgi:hypothetical protein
MLAIIWKQTVQSTQQYLVVDHITSMVKYRSAVISMILALWWNPVTFKHANGIINTINLSNRYRYNVKNK